MSGGGGDSSHAVLKPNEILKYFKKLWILMALLSITAMNAHDFKIHAGLTLGDPQFISDDTSNDLDLYSPKAGFTAGVTKEICLSENFSLEPALSFVNLAFEAEEQA